MCYANHRKDTGKSGKSILYRMRLPEESNGQWKMERNVSKKRVRFRQQENPTK